MTRIVLFIAAASIGIHGSPVQGQAVPTTRAKPGTTQAARGKATMPAGDSSRGTSHGAAGGAPSRTANGVTYTVMSIDRMGRSYPFGNARVDAKDGEEVVLVKLGITAAAGAVCCTAKDFSLETTTGAAAEPAWGEMNSSGPTTFANPFVAPKGARFRSFGVNGITIPLATLASERVAARGAAATMPPQGYVEGREYDVAEVVHVGDGDHRIAVEVVRNTADTVVAKVKVLGAFTNIGFTYGLARSAVVLRAGNAFVAAGSATFANREAAGDPPRANMLTTRMVTNADRGTLVLDTNEHPIVVTFAVPSDATGERRLQLSGFTVGDKKYSLEFHLPSPPSGLEPELP